MCIRDSWFSDLTGFDKPEEFRRVKTMETCWNRANICDLGAVLNNLVIR